MAEVPESVMNQQEGVFWFGGDGNAYVKGAQGTNSVGRVNDRTANYWSNLGFRQIADPVSNNQISIASGSGPQPGVNYAPTSSGTSTGSYSPTTATASPDAELKGSINSRFDELLGSLDKSKAAIGKSEGRFLGQLNKDFSTNQGNLQRSRDLGFENLDRSREKVQESKVRTLSELDANIRNAMDAGAIRLGNLGAADSSASGQLGFALTKLQNQNRGNVLRDVNQQNLDLNLAQKEVETEFANQLASLQNVLSSEKLRISEEFDRQRRLIEAEKQNANFERREALDNLSLQLAQQAANNIVQTEQQIVQQADSLASSYQNQFQTNTGAISSVADQAALTSSNVANRLQDQGNVNAGFSLQGGGAQGFNPFALPVRRDENNPLTVVNR